MRGDKNSDVLPKTAVEFKPHLSANQAQTYCCLCATLPTHAFLRPHFEPKGADCDCVGHESLATLIAVATATFSKRNHTLFRRERGAAVDFWDTCLLMVKEHRQRGGTHIYHCRTPPSVKRTCRGFPRPVHRRAQCFWAACSGATNTSTTRSPGRKRNVPEAPSFA